MTLCILCRREIEDPAKTGDLCAECDKDQKETSLSDEDLALSPDDENGGLDAE